MKVLMSLLVLALVGYSIAASTSGRGCIYVNGHCQRECEENTHAYTTGCGYLTPEATCENPEPTADTRGHICDYTACYCDAPTVRHDGKCIPLDQCPKEKPTEAPEPKKE